MAFIEISNLSAAGSDLFADADSFLTELQPTDTNQIFGGSKGGSWNRRRNWRGSGGKRSHGGGGGSRNRRGSGNSRRSHGGGRWYC